MRKGAPQQISAFAQTRLGVPFFPYLRVVFFLLSSLVCLFLNFHEYPPLMHLRGVISGSVHLLVSESSRPALWLNHTLERARALLSVEEENRILKENVRELDHWRTVARVLIYENKKLKESLRALPNPHDVVLTARVRGHIDHAQGHSLILDAGSDHGVAVNQPVLFEGRLIGRVTDVQPKTGMILLITDSTSRIPVEMETSHLKGILAGLNSERLTLLHEQDKGDFTEGELAFTTGEGGIFPAGALVGYLKKPMKGDWVVETRINWKKIDFVQLLAPLDPVPLKKETVSP